MPVKGLSRNTYCVLGIPIDVIDMSSVLRTVEAAMTEKSRFLVSTPNVNFLVTAQADREFRDTIIHSDLCPADGMPIIWIAKLIGVPLRKRVAGSDIFDALKIKRAYSDPIKVFLFGGAEGVAAEACQAINAERGGLRCVGSFFPGYGSVDEMSRDDILYKINSSNADFLVVSLGAKKGQTWLWRNRAHLSVPIQTHLGAAINFQAGKIKRAPRVMRALGLEWLWRIKEEPYLWRRYWRDGSILAHLLRTRIVPFAMRMVWLKLRYLGTCSECDLQEVQGGDTLTLSISGLAIARFVNKVVPAFQMAIKTKKRITIDFTNTVGIDARFMGLLLLMRKAVRDEGGELVLIGLSRSLLTLFQLNGADFMISETRFSDCV